jgi:N-acetylmuramic acid 6-phosphate etherase
VGIVADGEGRLLQRVEAGPANLKLLTDPQLLRHLRQFTTVASRPTAIGIGLAGARTEADWQRIRGAANRVWPGVPCHATHDLETALAAAQDSKGAGQAGNGETRGALPQVLALSGTGSCFYGRTPDGKVVRFGGWGHILGDKGSAYDIGLRSLKAVVYYYDRDAEWSKLGQSFLSSLQLNEPNQLIGWAQTAQKDEIAALAMVVFAAAKKRELITTDILAGAASSIAKDAASCAKRLVKAGTPVQFVFAGSVLLKQPLFAKRVARHLRELWPGAAIIPLQRESAWGAVELARRLVAPVAVAPVKRPPRMESSREKPPLSPTEGRHPRSSKLDTMPIANAITLMLTEEASVAKAILAERKSIEQTVRWIAKAFRKGGRLFYVGAGTSGRLGVLDASECPPTFRTSPEMVQGIMAGGQRAIWSAVEGAEDDGGAGARAIEFRGITKRDVVVGIAASGRTPYVWGALREARRRKARTVLVCFNPSVRALDKGGPELIIAPEIGPEILTGSTRLKAGTATKLILNIFTTLAMVQIGKVVSNLMVDLNPSNVKLRDRAVRIVRDLTKADYETAKAALEKSGWVVKDAWKALARRIKNTKGKLTVENA